MFICSARGSGGARNTKNVGYFNRLADARKRSPNGLELLLPSTIHAFLARLAGRQVSEPISVCRAGFELKDEGNLR